MRSETKTRLWGAASGLLMTGGLIGGWYTLSTVGRGVEHEIAAGTMDRSWPIIDDIQYIADAQALVGHQEFLAASQERQIAAVGSYVTLGLLAFGGYTFHKSGQAKQGA